MAGSRRDESGCGRGSFQVTSAYAAKYARRYDVYPQFPRCPTLAVGHSSSRLYQSSVGTYATSNGFADPLHSKSRTVSQRCPRHARRMTESGHLPTPLKSDLITDIGFCLDASSSENVDDFPLIFSRSHVFSSTYHSAMSVNVYTRQHVTSGERWA